MNVIGHSSNWKTFSNHFPSRQESREILYMYLAASEETVSYVQIRRCSEANTFCLQEARKIRKKLHGDWKASICPDHCTQKVETVFLSPSNSSVDRSTAWWRSDQNCFNWMMSILGDCTQKSMLSSLSLEQLSNQRPSSGWFHSWMYSSVSKNWAANMDLICWRIIKRKCQWSAASPFRSQ